jgi:hypothetical protein
VCKKCVRRSVRFRSRRVASRGRVVRLGALLGEVVFVLFERPAGVQHGFVAIRDGGDIADAEVDTRHTVAGCVGGFDLDATDDMQPPDAVFVHRTNLLNVLDGPAGRSDNVVLAEDEIAPRLLEVRTFREAEAVVRGVVLEARRLERDRRAGMVVAVVAVAGRIRVLVLVSALAVPTGERLTELLENSLTRLGAGRRSVRGSCGTP